MKNILKSLADFQQEVPVIHKGTEGYGYSYADLTEIFKIINPLLKKHGLGFTQPLDGCKVKTILFHVESGETLESSTDIPQDVSLAKMNEFQVLGSAITYIRRYSLSSILGLVTDKDTDASGEQVKKNEPTEWLNLEDKKGNKTEQAKALEKAIEQGQNFTLQGIRKKYKVSKVVAEQLKNNYKIQ